jgi:hypothetical protein
MEDGDTLHLARGAARQWLAGGKTLGVRDMPTHFGTIGYDLRYDEKAGNITGFVELRGSDTANIVLHIRLPGGRKISSVSALSKGTVGSYGTTIRWKKLTGKIYFEAGVI